MTARDVIVFLAGGYCIPATGHIWGIWVAEKKSAHCASVFERFMTAVIGGLLWPVSVWRYEPMN